MNGIMLVAGNMLRQTIRQRLFLNIVVFGVGMLTLSVVVSFLSYGYPFRVVRSLGLSGVALALNLMALLLAVSAIHQEIDKKTLFVLLTRPLTRMQYAVGRFLGLLAALVAVLAGFTVVYLVVLMIAGGTPQGLDLLALGACLPEAAILAGFGLVLSSFSTPTLSAGIGLGFWVAATTTDDLVGLTEDADPVAHGVAKVAYYVLPALSRFDFREAAVYADPVPAGEVVFVFVYGILYASMLVTLAGLILSRREMV